MKLKFLEIPGLGGSRDRIFSLLELSSSVAHCFCLLVNANKFGDTFLQFGSLMASQEDNYCGIQWLGLFGGFIFQPLPTPRGFNSTIKNGKGFGLELDKTRL